MANRYPCINNLFGPSPVLGASPRDERQVNLEHDLEGLQDVRRGIVIAVPRLMRRHRAVPGGARQGHRGTVVPTSWYTPARGSRKGHHPSPTSPSPITVNGGVPTARSGKVPKVILWLARAMVKLPDPLLLV